MNDLAADLAITLAVLERIAADRESGARKTLADYQAAFPGHVRLVAEAWSRAGPASFPEAPGFLDVPEAPRRLGHYRLERELGRGAQGIVWLATDERLGRQAAVKVLTGGWAASPDALRRFDQEARALAAIEHPNLCTIYEAFTHDGLPCLAVRFVPGETLAVVTAARGGVAPARPEVLADAALVETIARAMQAAHAAGITHRDLKPGNIMIGPDRTPVVLDFGLARRDSGQDLLTATGDIVGTPAYMAPEQAAGDVRLIGPGTDVHALGAILFELVTGTRPYAGATRSALLDAVRLDATPDPRRRNREVPRDLAIVIRTALAKAPADRYLSAADLAEDLRRVRNLEPIAARPPSAAGRLVRWARRRPMSAALALTLAVSVPALSVLGAWYIFSRPRVLAQERAVREVRLENLIARGFARLGGRRFPEALQCFDEAGRLRPGSREVLAGTVLVHCQRNRAAEALEILDRFQGGASGGVAALRRHVLKLLGRPSPEALDDSDPAAPADDVACYIEGRAHLAAAESGDVAGFERAYGLAEAAIQRAPARRLLYFDLLAHAIGRTGRHEEARRAADTLRIVCGGAQGELLAGVALVGSDPAGAADAFARAVALGADAVDAGYGLAAILGQQRKWPETAKICRELVALRPDDASLHMNLSIAETNAGRHLESLAAAERACELRPDIADHHAHRGYVLRDRLVRPFDALAAFEKAAAIDPPHAPWLAEFAFTAASTGRPKDAIEAAGRALALDGNLVLAWRARSAACSRLGDHPAALEAIARAADLEPEKPGVRIEQVRRLVASGEILKARRLFDRWQSRAGDAGIEHVVENALAELTAAESAR